ncbi:MAG: NAD(P)/FAD-dependent oxidoreductase [Polyangiales bacterium]
MTWDVAVIGAGVVGLACAARLAESGKSVIVIEREGRAGQGTSSRNSGVLHAGMYYATGTWKAKLCVRGNASLWAYCQRRSVPASRPGKLIVATDAAGEAKLAAILQKGRDNEVAELDWTTVDHARSLEPNVRCLSALWSPLTGIVDAHGVMDALAADARAAGADFAFHHRVEKIDPGFAIHVVDANGEKSTLEVARVVNAAGLHADEIAACAGIDVDAAGYRQFYVKGNYFRVRRRGLVSRLVYPVPEEGLAGLGIHVTVEIDGAAKLGPDVEPLAGRVMDYRVDEARAGTFFRAASTYLGGLELDDLSPDQSGIRPKLSRPNVEWTTKEPARDFVIAEESARGLPGLVNLVGIESPGLTCSLEIAREVEALL